MVVYPIPKNEQDNVMATLWSLLMSQEQVAMDGDILDKRLVEGAFRLWNRVTGDTKKAAWDKT